MNLWVLQWSFNFIHVLPIMPFYETFFFAFWHHMEVLFFIMLSYQTTVYFQFYHFFRSYLFSQARGVSYSRLPCGHSWFFVFLYFRMYQRFSNILGFIFRHAQIFYWGLWFLLVLSFAWKTGPSASFFRSWFFLRDSKNHWKTHRRHCMYRAPSKNWRNYMKVFEKGMVCGLVNNQWVVRVCSKVIC